MRDSPAMHAIGPTMPISGKESLLTKSLYLYLMAPAGGASTVEDDLTRATTHFDSGAFSIQRSRRLGSVSGCGSNRRRQSYSYSDMPRGL